MNALETLLREMIETEGPMPLESFMGFALSHPQHGYYMTREPFGAAGDFVTAPEISQMFGELLGLWSAQYWAAMGSPKTLRLLELGPGRGVLMQDFLRASAAVPAFRAALDVHLVETSGRLAQVQRARLAPEGVSVTWHHDLDSVPAGPTIAIANEFFDALPVRHYEKTMRGWCERGVGIDATGQLAIAPFETPEKSLQLDAQEGAILEIGAFGQQIMTALAARLALQGGAGLIIDYGHTRTQFGETLQAVRGHASVNPLHDPGESDITAHVDFDALARAARAGGAQTFGPVTQGNFLLRLGVVERTEALMRNANAQQGAELESALLRLVSKQGVVDTPLGKINGMGALFKVLAVTQEGLPQPAGFADDEGEE